MPARTLRSTALTAFRTLALVVILLSSITGLAGCFSPEDPPFYTCSTAQPRCPAAMACMPISGLDSAILTDWKYERSPAVCMPIPKLDKGAAKDGGVDKK